MGGHSHPTSLAEIPQWSRENKATTLEANIRFMKYVILQCLGSHAVTARGMVLKGGNALRFAFQSPRSTKDLDFTIAGDEIADDDQRLRSLLDEALHFAHRRFGVKAKCQRVERRPRASLASTRPTYSISVAYQLPSDHYFHNFEERNNIPTIIPVEVSFNDLICETRRWSDDNALLVCSLEDVLAEKLRSLLQQKIRNRNRYQDVYDIARYARHATIDRGKIGRFLVEKASAREIDVRKSSFYDVIRQRAFEEYDVKIREQAPRDFIPFDEAWSEVLLLVQSLGIPD